MGLPAEVAWDIEDDGIHYGGDAEKVLVMAYEVWKTGRPTNMRITLGANRFDGVRLCHDDSEQIFRAMQQIEQRTLEVSDAAI